VFLLGALEGAGYRPVNCSPAIRSYEGPFGVGYLVATYAPMDTKTATILNLARTAIAHFLETGNLLSPPRALPTALTHPAAAFVSLHNADGSLRGCIGTTVATQPDLAQEIIANAVAAATTDPRFAPVTPSELAKLKLSVDVLDPPQPAASPDDLDPERFGVIVTAADGRQGVLLPRLDGVTTAAEQIAICRQKAGIDPEEPIKLAKFEVDRIE
jgi:AmmeMemoRadiSam system protein A